MGLLDGDGHLLCHHFTGTWFGKERQPGERGQAFRLSFLQAVPASCTMFGGGAWIEDGGCEEEDADLPGSQDLSERGLGVEERADEAISTSSRVRGTLALGDVCQSACLHCTKERHEVWGGDAGD